MREDLGWTLNCDRTWGEARRPCRAQTPLERETCPPPELVGPLSVPLFPRPLAQRGPSWALTIGRSDRRQPRAGLPPGLPADSPALTASRPFLLGVPGLRTALPSTHSGAGLGPRVT